MNLPGLYPHREIEAGLYAGWLNGRDSHKFEGRVFNMEMRTRSESDAVSAEPGAALQIGAGVAQLAAPLPGADPDGAVGRAAAAAASGAAGVGGHPV